MTTRAVPLLRLEARHAYYGDAAPPLRWAPLDETAARLRRMGALVRASAAGLVVGALDAFGDTGENRLWDRSLADQPAAAPFLRLARGVQMFDRIDALTDGTAGAAFEVSAPGPTFPLWYWRTDGLKVPLALSFAAYLRAALDAVAVEGWQLLYVDLDRLRPDDAFESRWLYPTLRDLPEEARETLERAERSFPDHDWTELARRYETVRSRFGP